MTPIFEFDRIATTIFGVGRDDGPGQVFEQVPVGADVQGVLCDMLIATWEAMKRQGDPAEYGPAEKHARIEFLYMPTSAPLARPLKDLYDAVNLPLAVDVLQDPQDLYSYFAQFIDDNGNRVTALRRASQFKGILRSRNRLIQLVDDTLQIVREDVFKLDTDFDLIIDSSHVYILRPSGFEFAGKLQQAILDAVPDNVERLKREVAFVNFDAILSYASERPRAARYLASILTQPNNGDITLERLSELCKRTGVNVTTDGEHVEIEAGSEMGFLELLDRRRYEVDLTEADPEIFRASSRSKIGGNRGR